MATLLLSTWICHLLAGLQSIPHQAYMLYAFICICIYIVGVFSQSRGLFLGCTSCQQASWKPGGIAENRCDSQRCTQRLWSGQTLGNQPVTVFMICVHRCLYLQENISHWHILTFKYGTGNAECCLGLSGRWKLGCNLSARRPFFSSFKTLQNLQMGLKRARQDSFGTLVSC